MIYPPIINYAMPSFNYEDKVKIYFAISTYNSKDEIKQAQVTVRYQINNANALNTSTYPNKIKVCDITEVLPEDDPVVAATAARYYIEINPNDLITGKFDTSLIYKVQVRFSNKVQTNTTSINQLAANASEWSTVCLIKPIQKPEFRVVELEFTDEQSNDEQDETVTTILSTLEPDFTGIYIPTTITETLKYWRMKLYNSTGEILLADTGKRTANNFDSQSGRVSFDAHLEYIMTHNETYVLIYQIETKNGYTAEKRYSFTAMSYASGNVNAQLNLVIDQEDGFAKVILSSTTGAVVHTNITLRRTSSKSNFTIWEDIANKTFENSALNWTYYDFTIESGVFYQYGAQTRDNRGRRSSMIKSQQEIGEWDDAFLTQRSGKDSLEDVVQLKIRYDMNIANTMVNIGESKVDTIGSKYPFVRRNGNMYYHTFPFSFLITAYTDNNHIFATEKELKDNQLDLYSIAYNETPLEVYTGRYNYTYEREFREKVESFLYNNKVKLFRSLTEGNFLIKLMGITLTPKQELGRLLYSVDATAVEIDEPTIANLDYYGIQEIGTYNPNIVFNEAKIGQLNNTKLEWSEDGTSLSEVQREFEANGNVMEAIERNYNLGEIVNGVKIQDLFLSYLRIEIDSDPYLIKNINGVLTPLDDIIDPDYEIPNSETLLGTLIKINDNIILIEYPNNIYEIKGDNVHIDSSWTIVPLKNTKMSLDFAISLSQSNDTTRTATTLIYKPVNGQLAETFGSEASIYTKIWYKYFLDFYGCKNISKPYYLKINTIYTLNLEAEPKVVFYARSNTQTQMERFVIDETGELFIDPGVENGYVADAYFYGRNIETRLLTSYNDIPEKPFQYDSYDDIEGKHIFYNGKWYLGTSFEDGASYDIACPVDGLVNYYIQTQRGIY